MKRALIKMTLDCLHTLLDLPDNVEIEAAKYPGTEFTMTNRMLEVFVSGDGLPDSAVSLDGVERITVMPNYKRTSQKETFYFDGWSDGLEYVPDVRVTGIALKMGE
jgi:hypothetical protein